MKKINMENEIKIEQFIGIFSNVINDEICSAYVKWFNIVSEQNLTMSSKTDSGMPIDLRKDEVIHIPRGLPNGCFPSELNPQLWKNISECYNRYHNEFEIHRNLTSYGFKVHRVLPTGGYHMWHHEHAFNAPYRVLAWHLTLEAPTSGGETEFLFQSLKIKPRVGQLLIWPAGFTHQHRGNPPLEGQKTYMTGWFDVEASEKVKYE
jgi:hypothetical protein